MGATATHHHGLPRKWFMGHPWFLGTLLWHYGPDRTARIMRDEDSEIAEDIERWRRIGEKA